MKTTNPIFPEITVKTVKRFFALDGVLSTSGYRFILALQSWEHLELFFFVHLVEFRANTPLAGAMVTYAF